MVTRGFNPEHFFFERHIGIYMPFFIYLRGKWLSDLIDRANLKACLKINLKYSAKVSKNSANEMASF